MRTATLLFLLMTMLAGCGITGGERTDYKDDAEKVHALEVPPDLVLPKTDDHYTVPEGGNETTASYSDYVKSNAQNPSCICKDAVAAPASSVQPAPQAAAQPPRLQDMADGSKSILMGEPFDRCWLRIGQALDGAGIVVDDKDRSKGLFFLRGGKNQVAVKTTAAGCEVAASNGSSEAKGIIEALYKQLGK
jgi:uncharacterized lipoprotein